MNVLKVWASLDADDAVDEWLGTDEVVASFHLWMTRDRAIDLMVQIAMFVQSFEDESDGKHLDIHGCAVHMNGPLPRGWVFDATGEQIEGEVTIGDQLSFGKVVRG